MKKLIDDKKKQLKANLHCHSVLSDGRWTPEQIKEEYAKRGYSVVAITDHERLVPHHDLSDENILFLTAYEMYVRTMPFDYEQGLQSHMNLYSLTPENKMVYYTPDHTRYIPKEELETLEYHEFVEHRRYDLEFIKQAVEKAREYGFLVCHNHPSWSLEDESIAPAYSDCFAMEIYNHASMFDGFTGYDRQYYEHQLRRGCKIAPIAADDNHDKHSVESEYNDSFGGVTYILADKLEYGAVTQALQRQDFYASTGARVFSLTAEDGVLSVQTSEAKYILFWTNTHSRKLVVAPAGQTVTSAEFKPSEKVEWVCVEVTDEFGKKAFTRAYYRNEWGEE